MTVKAVGGAVDGQLSVGVASSERGTLWMVRRTALCKERKGWDAGGSRLVVTVREKCSRPAMCHKGMKLEMRVK